MAQERIDVTLRFLDGPLAWQEDLVRRGPMVRVGSNPGPDGLKLEGYRGIDDRHAVISAYKESEVTIAPVGPNQVRVAEGVDPDWGAVLPIRGPVHLSPGCVVHLGPAGRGATFSFLKAERLGAWRGGAVISEAAQADDARPSDVRELDVRRRVPVWFLPLLALMTTGTAALVTLVVILIRQRDVEPLGPVDDGVVPDLDDAGAVFAVTRYNPDVYAGLKEEAFYTFVMGPNLEAAPGLAALRKEPGKWDTRLMDYTARSMQMYLRLWNFWKDLDQSRDTYARVLVELRRGGLPDVLAAVPYQESHYNPLARDRMLCAGGLWQFQPETASRYDLRVDACRFADRPGELWAPRLKAPPMNAIRNADYVQDGRCRITSCEVDDRYDPTRATKAAVTKFQEVWADAELRPSGALVQMTIASHNCGYDDAPYRNGVTSLTNVKPAYARWRREKEADGVRMFGASITCKDQAEMSRTSAENINASCGSYLPNVTQTYVPAVIAQHLLAVCYYGKNYPQTEAFRAYADFTRAGRYCAALEVPTAAAVRAHVGGGG